MNDGWKDHLIDTSAGIRAILGHPEVLQALNPMWGLRFFLEHPRRSRH